MQIKKTMRHHAVTQCSKARNQFLNHAQRIKKTYANQAPNFNNKTQNNISSKKIVKSFSSLTPTFCYPSIYTQQYASYCIRLRQNKKTGLIIIKWYNYQITIFIYNNTSPPPCKKHILITPHEAETLWLRHSERYSSTQPRKITI